MDSMEEDESGPLGHLNLNQISLGPRFMPIHEVVPRLTLYERVRLDTLTSLNFMEFQSQVGITMHPERSILYKGFRILEKRIERIMDGGAIHDGNRLEAFLVYLKIGHICLLAADYARALSAYQQAYNLAEEHFWKDPGAYFGLGIVYLHFKAYGCAIESFNRHLYSNPTSIIASETNARLGVCYKAVKQFPDAIRHFQSALNDRVAPHFLSHEQIKLNVALTHDSAGNIDKAYKECTKLLGDSHYPHLKAAVERELGWLCYRAVDADICQTMDERRNKLMEAEQHLQESKLLHPESGKTHYYLGRCYGEQTPTKAHDAFLNYRASIDKSESDSDTWCSIGVLYHQQNQPMDALQAFVCAVDLDPEHSAAWTNLGNLYENHFRFVDALKCYKNAIKFNPTSPEVIKARITAIERELQQSPALNTHQPRQGPYLQQGVRLPALKEAGMQPIPSELRQRQEDHIKSKQQKYRDGSILWRMAELATTTTQPNIHPDAKGLDPSQLNMLRILKFNETELDHTTTEVLRSLERRLAMYGCAEGTDLPLCEYTVDKLPSELETEDALRHYTSLFDVDEEGNPVKKPKEEEPDSPGEPETPTPTGGGERSTSMRTELPKAFSLLAPLKIPIDLTASELMAMAALRSEKPNNYKEIFEERVAPPSPTIQKKATENLFRATPYINVESRKDAHSVELQRFCEVQPIALVRGLAVQLKMDLSVFSTKTLAENFPTHELEVRTQLKMHPDINVDNAGMPTWKCESERSYSTIGSYAKYQADSFKASLKEETERLKMAGSKYGGAAETAKRRKMAMEESSPAALKTIKFGTNIDFSDDVKFKAQLNELAKMPPFCRIIAGCNLLSHLGHPVYGMNTAQGYMKIPGNRTPAHMENNCLASINLNIGPGDCEWFGVPHDYWGNINKECGERNIDFLKDSWWPNMDELMSMGIPVYRFTQKAGDLVYVGPGCVHWVQSTGWCNNIAWNVAPITHTQFSMAVAQYEYNRLAKYQSLVPMQNLFWQIAKNVRVTNQKVYSLVRGMLIRSLAYCKMIADWASKHVPIKIQPRGPGGVSHYCTACQIEVFNILFCKDEDDMYYVYCVDCARKTNFGDYHVLQEIPFPDLQQIFDNFQLHMISKATLVA